MRPSRSPQSNCVTCALDAARRRLAGRRRAPGAARVARLVRRAGLAAALGIAGVVPAAVLAPAPAAEARTLIDLPALKLRVPVRQPGYQLATAHGDVVPFGAAASGRVPADAFANPVTAVARTRSGAGSWSATADGGVFTSGDAKFYGSLAGRASSRTVALAATPSGRGYWLATETGGVFTFGDATFRGSLPAGPHGAVVALVPTPTGRGYWLATAGGGVFTFGDATFRGSIGELPRTPVTAMAATPSGRGYWLAAEGGGVFAFGDARFHGRPEPGQLRSKVVGMAASRTGRGYWLASADGGVFSFGDAPFLGSSSAPGGGAVVAIAAGAGRPVPKAAQVLPRRLLNRYGNDISWPQCGSEYPAAGYGHGIVGVTGGRPFTKNRCLASQWQWALAGGSGAAVYVNVASPRQGEAMSMQGPAGSCGINDLPCQVYNHSANNMQYALAYARESGVDAPMWWIDVEWLNYWSKNQALNALTVKAAAETLQKAGLRVGVYSTWLQWRTITGDDRNGLPVWHAGARTDAEAPSFCDRPDRDFTGGGVWLVQSIPVRFDVNYACAPVVADPEAAFRFRD